MQADHDADGDVPMNQQQPTNPQRPVTLPTAPSAPNVGSFTLHFPNPFSATLPPPAGPPLGVGPPVAAPPRGLPPPSPSGSSSAVPPAHVQWAWPMNYYFAGKDQSSPIGLEFQFLLERIQHQDYALCCCADLIVMMRWLQTASKPTIRFLAGPPSTGKTELVLLMAMRINSVPPLPQVGFNDLDFVLHIRMDTLAKTIGKTLMKQIANFFQRLHGIHEVAPLKYGKWPTAIIFFDEMEKGNVGMWDSMKLWVEKVGKGEEGLPTNWKLLILGATNVGQELLQDRAEVCDIEALKKKQRDVRDAIARLVFSPASTNKKNVRPIDESSSSRWMRGDVILTFQFTPADKLDILTNALRHIKDQIWQEQHVQVLLDDVAKHFFSTSWAPHTLIRALMQDIHDKLLSLLASATIVRPSRVKVTTGVGAAGHPYLRLDSQTPLPPTLLPPEDASLTHTFLSDADDEEFEDLRPASPSTPSSVPRPRGGRSPVPNSEEEMKEARTVVGSHAPTVAVDHPEAQLECEWQDEGGWQFVWMAHKSDSDHQQATVERPDVPTVPMHTEVEENATSLTVSRANDPVPVKVRKAPPAAQRISPSVSESVDFTKDDEDHESEFDEEATYADGTAVQLSASIPNSAFSGRFTKLRDVVDLTEDDNLDEPILAQPAAPRSEPASSSSSASSNPADKDGPSGQWLRGREHDQQEEALGVPLSTSHGSIAPHVQSAVLHEGQKLVDASLGLTLQCHEIESVTDSLVAGALLGYDWISLNPRNCYEDVVVQQLRRTRTNGVFNSVVKHLEFQQRCNELQKELNKDQRINQSSMVTSSSNAPLHPQESEDAICTAVAELLCITLVVYEHELGHDEHRHLVRRVEYPGPEADRSRPRVYLIWTGDLADNANVRRNAFQGSYTLALLESPVFLPSQTPVFAISSNEVVSRHILMQAELTKRYQPADTDSRGSVAVFFDASVVSFLRRLSFATNGASVSSTIDEYVTPLLVHWAFWSELPIGTSRVFKVQGSFHEKCFRLHLTDYWTANGEEQWAVNFPVPELKQEEVLSGPDYNTLMKHLAETSLAKQAYCRAHRSIGLRALWGIRYGRFLPNLPDNDSLARPLMATRSQVPLQIEMDYFQHFARSEFLPYRQHSEVMARYNKQSSVSELQRQPFRYPSWRVTLEHRALMEQLGVWQGKHLTHLNVVVFCELPFLNVLRNQSYNSNPETALDKFLQPLLQPLLPTWQLRKDIHEMLLFRVVQSSVSRKQGDSSEFGYKLVSCTQPFDSAPLILATASSAISTMALEVTPRNQRVTGLQLFDISDSAMTLLLMVCSFAQSAPSNEEMALLRPAIMEYNDAQAVLCKEMSVYESESDSSTQHWRELSPITSFLEIRSTDLLVPDSPSSTLASDSQLSGGSSPSASDSHPAHQDEAMPSLESFGAASPAAAVILAAGMSAASQITCSALQAGTAGMEGLPGDLGSSSSSSASSGPNRTYSLHDCHDGTLAALSPIILYPYFQKILTVDRMEFTLQFDQYRQAVRKTGESKKSAELTSAQHAKAITHPKSRADLYPVKVLHDLLPKHFRKRMKREILPIDESRNKFHKPSPIRTPTQLSSAALPHVP